MLKKTKQNKTKQQQQKKNGVHSEIRNIEKKNKKTRKNNQNKNSWCQFFIFTFLALQWKFSVHLSLLIKLCSL